MSVAITIQETVNEVDITVNQNVITVNVTRTTGGGGVESINGETGVVVLTTDNVNEGLINLYFTAARVRATVLTGISFVSGIAITATDTILSALGKLQKQISSIDLPYVLKIGDRVYQEITTPTHTFVVDDRWKDTLFYGTTDILLDDDADTFPLDSVLSFHVYDTTALFNFTVGTDVRYLGTTASADIPIEVGDDCRLKKISTGVVIWELIISNKSTGGASSQNLNQVLTEGNTSDKTIVLNNGTNVTIIEPGATSIQNISTTAGVGLSETGVGIYTQDEMLGVEIHTDNITETYIAQFPDKIGGSDEIIAMQSDLTALSSTIGLPTILAIDNKTNDIPIVSNNGKAAVDVNDAYTSLSYETQVFAMGDTGVQLYSEVPVTFDSTVSTNFNTPVLNYNTEEVATQPYADAKVADNLTASTTVAPSKTAVNTALDLKIDKTSWVDYSATSTIVGWSSFTVKKISYKIIDDAMIVDFNLEGTSNATTISFTIPSNAASYSYVLSAYIINNGYVPINPGRIVTVSGSNVITVQRDSQSPAFVASGTKRCSGQIIIQL